MLGGCRAGVSSGVPRHRVGELGLVYYGFCSGDLTKLFERFEKMEILGDLQVYCAKNVLILMIV